MTDMFTLRLRPNTFLTLLIRAARSEFGNSPAWGRSSNGLTRATLFTDLMHILDTSTLPPQDTLATYMSDFLSGKRAYSNTYYPFNQASFQAKAQMRMDEDYMGALREMDALCQKYLKVGDPLDMRLLVGGLMETIILDDSFTGAFDIGGRRIEKSDFENQDKVLLQPFLLDVWFQVATMHHNSRDAAETYKQWTDKGSPRQVTTRIGTEMGKKITVSTTLPEETSADTAEDETVFVEETQEAVSMVLPGDEKQSWDDGHERQQADGSDQQTGNTYQTFINNGLFVAHQEGKITNIPHVENLTINMGD